MDSKKKLLLVDFCALLSNCRNLKIFTDVLASTLRVATARLSDNDCNKVRADIKIEGIALRPGSLRRAAPNSFDIH
jgi:hypothetical protein